MLILHPYGDSRLSDQAETWVFLETVRDGLGFTVIDRNVTGSGEQEKWNYVEFVKEHWGKEDLIILEDDKVPTMRDLYELSACPRPFCYFPHPIQLQFRTTMNQWKKDRPYSTGFVKFSVAAQIAIPSDSWGPYIFSYREGRPSIDMAIEKPMTDMFGPMHLHERMIKHNHRPTVNGILKQQGAKLLAVIR